ncbi:hypothetical protein ES703_101942 [subsurface metagenome]
MPIISVRIDCYFPFRYRYIGYSEGSFNLDRILSLIVYSQGIKQLLKCSLDRCGFV